jgi:tetratricopeptide (TPR) repeat protein
MKKAFIALGIVLAFFVLLATDLFVNPIQDWVRKNPSHSSAPRVQYSVAGYLYMVAQRQGRAVELYQTAFKLFPGHPDEAEAHYRVGLYYESRKDYPKAIEQYQLIMDKWPDMAQRLALSQRIARFDAYQGGG